MNKRQNHLFVSALAVMAVLVLAIPATISVYATQGPFIVIGPPNDAETLAAFSDGDTVHVAYGSIDGGTAAAGPGVYYGLVLSGPGGNSEELQDAPENIIPGGTDPAIFVAGGKTFVAADAPGENDPDFATCPSDDDDECEPSRPVGTDAPSDVVVEIIASGEEENIYDPCNDKNPKNFCPSDGGNRVLPGEYDAFLVIPPYEQWAEPIPGTQWISGVPDGEVCPDECNFFTFRATFELPDEAINPTLDIEMHADGFADVFLNPIYNDDGFIGESGSETVDAADNYQDPPDMVSTSDADLFIYGDENTLEFNLSNLDNPGGLDYKATLTYELAGIEGEGGSLSCSDGIDNDGDENTDAADSNCFPNNEGSLCGDGADNDGDFDVDYGFSEGPDADSDCFIPSESEQPSSCTDLVDNDGDVLVDGDDPDCFISLTSFPTFSDIQLLQSVVYNLFFGTPQITYVQATTCDPASSPQVTASPDGFDVYFVWQDCGEIMFQASHDGGLTFEDAMNLSNNAGTSQDPRIALTGIGTVVVTWQDNTPGNEEIFYSRSTDGGATFNGGAPVGSPVNLSNTNKKSDDHQLKALDDDVYVTWVDYKTGNGDIYFRAAKDNDGASFAATKNLSTNVLSFMASRDPDLAAHEAMVSVVWTVHLDKNALLPGEIIFRESLNEGSTFGKQIPISKTLFKASKTPQLDYTDDGERYVAWLDKGGPVRNFIATGTFAVLASESEDGKNFTAAINQSDSPDNPKGLVDATLLEVVGDVTVFDPGSRRG